METVLKNLPAPNSLTGLFVYTFTFYIITFAIAWCLQPKGFDLESHRKKIIKAREEREAKAQRLLAKRNENKDK
ncbi:unnamed protein product [Blepharisma stoltei]|uniref:Uncharacterized protein n=1 Tax=Blepharisma stoltei TaxID=1481888 RepID=A0AAU9JUU7_9CILI|nr:unnamed protein product [Blepharisma stoltei]